MKFTLETPEVAALLAGTFRCSPQTYLRICSETGTYFIYPIRKRLIALGMCSKTASALLKAANIQTVQFNRGEADPTPVPAPEKPARRGPPRTSEEEREAKRAKAEAAQNSKRYQLIVSASRKNGATKHGIWDGVAGTVLELFCSRDEALEALIQLKTGNSYAI